MAIPTSMQYFNELLGEQLGGGGGSSWQTIFDGNVVTAEEGGDVAGNVGTITYPSPISNDVIRVTFSETVYECQKLSDGSYGAPYDEGTNTYDWSEYPFEIYPLDTGSSYVYTQNAGTYTLRIEEEQGGGGSSDLSTAQVTVNGNASGDISITGCFACHVPDSSHEYMMMTFGRFGEALVLYKGASYIIIDNPQQRTINVSGNIEEDSEATGAYFVTGDCTITVTVTA